MKMIAGSCLRAIANSLRMRAAPRPANISTKAAADCAKNCAPDSCATALASSVLPVPGGPCSRIPLGTVRAQLAELLGVAQELDDLLQLGLGLGDAGDVIPTHRLVGGGLDLLRLDPRHHLQHPPHHADDRDEEQDRHDGLPVERPVLDVCAIEVPTARIPRPAEPRGG